LPEPKTKPALPVSVIVDAYKYNWQDIYTSPTKDLNLLLKPVLDTYKLSSTHLNDFLAVNRGGPKSFLYKHILRVPEELNPNAIYGDSVHKTLEYVHKQLNTTSKLPNTATIKEFFVDRLVNQPLTKDEYKYFRKRGEDNLLDWIDQNKQKFSEQDISEHNFSSEQIVVEGAKLTGKIDVIRPEEGNQVVVVDYKTSLPMSEWTGHSGDTAINAHKYQKQLLFYKLLLDNSTYLTKKQTAKRGVIEFITPDINDKFVEISYDFDDSEVAKLTKLIGVVWKKIINLDLPNTDDYPPTIKGVRAFEDDLLNGKI
jgi:DNA helicase-2/ATP-dependent DNA helicase PcrA